MLILNCAFMEGFIMDILNSVGSVTGSNSNNSTPSNATGAQNTPSNFSTILNSTMNNSQAANASVTTSSSQQGTPTDDPSTWAEMAMIDPSTGQVYYTPVDANVEAALKDAVAKHIPGFDVDCVSDQKYITPSNIRMTRAAPLTSSNTVQSTTSSNSAVSNVTTPQTVNSSNVTTVATTNSASVSTSSQSAPSVTGTPVAKSIPTVSPAVSNTTNNTSSTSSQTATSTVSSALSQAQSAALLLSNILNNIEGNNAGQQQQNTPNLDTIIADLVKIGNNPSALNSVNNLDKLLAG